MTGPVIRIRPADESDMAFIHGLSQRLSDVPRPDWHDLAAMRAFQGRFMTAMLGDPPPVAALLVAVDGAGQRLGFVQALPGRDGVTDEACGYVSLLALDLAAEGQGIAAALMAAVEDWAVLAGFRLLSLDVFATNQRALRFYERCGFRPESLRMVKVLGAAGPSGCAPRSAP
ncbi:GNAT family N-acetyltransferase [Geminicoccus roseus]|uniref:GNAT family N-acetyltransferase n=1 Tax=Geminicoccus roseus TaxID=404900 RepID=UPI000683FF65|nr:GNAT family N-acetyltransferase [Geminicoccus roseus]